MREGGKRAMERRNWGAAKDHLNKAIEVAADCVDLLLMRAQVHRELGDRENVLADTGKALKVRRLVGFFRYALAPDGQGILPQSIHSI